MGLLGTFLGDAAQAHLERWVGNECGHLALALQLHWAYHGAGGCHHAPRCLLQWAAGCHPPRFKTNHLAASFPCTKRGRAPAHPPCAHSLPAPAPVTPALCRGDALDHFGGCGWGSPTGDAACRVSSCVHQQCLAVGRRAAPLLVLILRDPCSAAGAARCPLFCFCLGGCWEDTEQTNCSNNAFQEPLASSRSAEVRVMSTTRAPALEAPPRWRGERPPEPSCGRLCGKETSCASAPTPPKEHF